MKQTTNTYNKNQYYLDTKSLGWVKASFIGLATNEKQEHVLSQHTP